MHAPECKHYRLMAGLGRQCRGPSLFLFPALPSFLLPAAAVPTEPSPPSSISCPASTSFFTDKTEAIFKVLPLLLNESAPVHLAVFLYSAFLPGPPPSEGPHCPAPRSLAGSAFPLFCSPFSRLLCLSPLAPLHSLPLPAAYRLDQSSRRKQTSVLLRILPVSLPQKSCSSRLSEHDAGPPSFAQVLLSCSFPP